jgi:hypothetical protein
MNASPERSALERTERILAQPVRMCGIAHEDASRDHSGKALFDEYDLEEDGVEERESDVMILPECVAAMKHLGCPHFRKLYGEALSDGLTVLAAVDPDSAPAVAELNAIQDAQATLDEKVRAARLGSKEDILADRIPDAETAERNAAPFVKEFHANCRRIEALRVGLLEKIANALRAPTGKEV